MQTILKKWGNSVAVRIPASLLQGLQIKLDDTVDVREEAGRIVIEKVQPNAHTLTALLNGITSENLHASVDTGAASGREIW